MITFRAGLNREGIILENSKYRTVFIGWPVEDSRLPLDQRFNAVQWRAVAEILSPAEEPTTFEVVHAVTKEVLYRSP